MHNGQVRNEAIPQHPTWDWFFILLLRAGIFSSVSLAVQDAREFVVPFALLAVQDGQWESSRPYPLGLLLRVLDCCSGCWIAEPRAAAQPPRVPRRSCGRSGGVVIRQPGPERGLMLMREAFDA